MDVDAAGLLRPDFLAALRCQAGNDGKSSDQRFLPGMFQNLVIKIQNPAEGWVKSIPLWAVWAVEICGRAPLSGTWNLGARSACQFLDARVILGMIDCYNIYITVYHQNIQFHRSKSSKSSNHPYSWLISPFVLLNIHFLVDIPQVNSSFWRPGSALMVALLVCRERLQNDSAFADYLDGSLGMERCEFSSKLIKK